MSQTVITYKPASALHVGDRVMEEKRGGGYRHDATVVRVAFDDDAPTRRAWTVTLQTPRELGDVVFTRRYHEDDDVIVEVVV